MHKTSTYGLKLTQMAELFSLGSEDLSLSTQDHTQDMAQFLREQLTCRLPKGTLFCDVLLMTMARQGCDISCLEGRTLNDLLLNEQTNILLLKTIKNAAKELAANLDSQVEIASATCLYFSALASGLVHHNQKLSQYSYTRLQKSFSQMTEKNWMTKEIVDLFIRAKDLCLNIRGEL